MTGIAELFAELADASRAHYEMQLEMWCLWSRERYGSANRAKDWRAANRERVRKYDAARVGRARKPKRDSTQCISCKQPAVPGKRSCAEHLAKSRARAAKAAQATIS